MTLKEAYDIVSKQLDDYKDTSDNFESVFPGATSAYRPIVDAYTIAASAIQKEIAVYGEDHEP